MTVLKLQMSVLFPKKGPFWNYDQFYRFLLVFLGFAKFYREYLIVIFIIHYVAERSNKTVSERGCICQNWHFFVTKSNEVNAWAKTFHLTLTVLHTSRWKMAFKCTYTINSCLNFYWTFPIMFCFVTNLT